MFYAPAVEMPLFSWFHMHEPSIESEDLGQTGENSQVPEVIHAVEAFPA
jgi:hypothetical protein